MSDDIDFTEIDQIMADMEDDKKFTNAVAADVAKAELIVKAKKPPKPKATKKSATKPAAKKTTAKKPLADKSKKSAEPEDKGELVKVKILSKPKPEESEPELRPNPKTGKYMDLVNPLSDMSIQGDRPSNPLPEIVPIDDADEDAVIEVSETKVIAVIDGSADAQEPETDIDDPSEDDQGPTLGDMIDEYEANGDPEPEPDGIEPELEPEPESEPSESEPTQISKEEPASADEVDDDEPFKDIIADFGDMDDELSLSDLDTPFLENVTVEKRPLGGGDPVLKETKLNELLKAEESLAPDAAMEARADREFVNDGSNKKWLNNTDRNHEKHTVNQGQDGRKSDYTKPAKRGIGAFLTVMLIILLVVLGVAIGGLVYFSTQY